MNDNICFPRNRINVIIWLTLVPCVTEVCHAERTIVCSGCGIKSSVASFQKGDLKKYREEMNTKREAYGLA